MRNSKIHFLLSLARLLASPERAAEVEAFVLAHSRIYSDEYARDFLFGKPYTTLVLPVAPCGPSVSPPACFLPRAMAINIRFFLPPPPLRVRGL